MPRDSKRLTIVGDTNHQESRCYPYRLYLLYNRPRVARGQVSTWLPRCKSWGNTCELDARNMAHFRFGWMRR
jgi:hypothetical protein